MYKTLSVTLVFKDFPIGEEKRTAYNGQMTRPQYVHCLEVVLYSHIITPLLCETMLGPPHTT